MSGDTSVLLSELPSAGRKENDETLEAIKDMISQFAAMVTQVEFPTTAIAAGAGEETPVPIEVRDANDIRSLFGENAIKRVTVAPSGTAANPEISLDGGLTWQPFTAATSVFFKKGLATPLVREAAGGTGTIILTLGDPDSTGLTLGGAATVTIS